MKFNFKSFQFDCEKQILTQNGNVITLNEKPAHLLTLFLFDVKKIHTKAEILDFVWPDRVVTDQVVFQNINYLRSLFGRDAIKTFTRKGYQWQIPLEKVEDKVLQNDHIESTSTVENTPHNLVKNSFSSHKRPIYISMMIALLVIILLRGIPYNVYSTPTFSNSNTIVNNRIFTVNIKNQQWVKRPLMALESNQNLFDSPYSTWKQHVTNENQLLIAIRLYPIADKQVLRFHIQGANSGWHDYIYAEDEKLAMKEFTLLLSELVLSDYFSIHSDYELLAKLTLLLNKQPQHELLNMQLIKQTYKLNDLDRATILINQQLATKPTILRQGLLNLIKTDITMKNRRWPESRKSAVQALKIFKRLELPQLESRALIKFSWMHLIDKKFRQGMQLLNQAASKARESKEPLLEVNAHIIQSFIASKAGQTELAHTQIDLAKEIIEFHQLSDEHQVLVQKNLAWITKSSAPIDSLEHYKNILHMPFSPQYGHYFYTASMKVLDAYTKQQNWELAATVIKPWQRLSFQMLINAHISYAQGNTKQGLKYANEAFELAQISLKIVDALDAALLILQNKKCNNQLNSTDYYHFIKQNSTRIWLDQNSIALTELNIVIN